MANLQSARGRARAMVTAAEERLQAARENVEAERETHRSNIVAAARAGANTATAEATGLREARSAETSAQDDLDGANAALQAFEAELRYEPRFSGKAGDPVTFADEARRDAAFEVVKVEAASALPRLIEDAEKAFTLATAKRAAIVRLVQIDAVPVEHRKAVRAACRSQMVPGVSTRGSEDDFQMFAHWPPSSDGSINRSSAQIEAVNATWESAFEALCGDADAPLPLGPS